MNKKQTKRNTKINLEKDDPINPNHYKQGGMEVIDVLDCFLSYDEYMGFLKGNVIKYTCRANNKNGIEDLKKAQWYINKVIEAGE